jgi:hypothetical protein
VNLNPEALDFAAMGLISIGDHKKDYGLPGWGGIR